MKNAPLWKRILFEGICVESNTDARGKEAGKKWADKIVSAPIIVDRSLKVPSGSVTWGDYRNVSVPFSKFWLEGTSMAQSEWNGKSLSEVGLWGALVMHDRKPDGASSVGTFIFFGGDGRPVTWVGGTAFWLNSNAEYDASKKMEVIYSKEMAGLYGVDAAGRSNQTVTAYILDMLTVLGCRNVGLEPREHEFSVAKTAAKRHGGNASGYRYHVLIVRPAGSKPGVRGEEIGIMPHHVCRGHLQHYGPASVHGHPDGKDRGLLFGLHAGRFYCPPHLKGDKKNGIVEKDYELRVAQ